MADDGKTVTTRCHYCRQRVRMTPLTEITERLNRDRPADRPPAEHFAIDRGPEHAEWCPDHHKGAPKIHETVERLIGDLAALRARVEKAEKERDDAIERAEEEERRCSSMVSARDLTIRDLRAELSGLRARAERAERALAAMRDQIAHEGCEASRVGEYTYECDATKPCGLCRLRGRAERYREALDAARDLERAFSDDDPPALVVTRPEATRRVMLLRAALAATGDEEGKGGDRR